MSEQDELDLTPGSTDENGTGSPQTIGEAVDAIRRGVLSEREKGPDSRRSFARCFRPCPNTTCARSGAFRTGPTGSG